MSIDRLKFARAHLRDWQAGSRAVSAAAIEAQKLEEQLDWEIRALEKRPAGFAAYPPVIEDQAAEVLRRVASTFPVLPALDQPAITRVNSITTTTANTTLSWVMTVGQSGSPGADLYADVVLSEYRAIQERQHLPEEVGRLLDTTFPGLRTRWDDTRAAYGAARGGTQSPTAFGIAARNFIDGLKGELLGRARRMPDESLSVDQAVDRLFATSILLTDVQREVLARGEIISALSDIAKARVLGTLTTIDGAWSRVINHALIVLRALPNEAGEPHFR